MNRRTGWQIMRATAGIVGAIALTSLSACTHLVAGSPSYKSEWHSEGGHLVKVRELATLLLLPPEIGELVKVPVSLAAVSGDLATTSSDVTPEKMCVGALYMATEPAYRGSRYGGVASLGMTGANNLIIGQAAVAFVDTAAARQLVERQVSQWKDCVNKVLTVADHDAPPVHWVATGPSTAYGVRVLPRTEEGASGYSCSHGLESAANVVADVLICGNDKDHLTDQAAAIVGGILAKIPA